MLARALYYFYWLRRNLSHSLAELQELQRKKLVAMIRHAYENVPFYHDKFTEAGIKPNEIKSIDDLPKIPLTTKFQMQSKPLDVLLARGAEAEKCTESSTSGSTGKPLVFYLDKSSNDFRFALLSRTYWEDGLRPWDKMAIIRYPHSRYKSMTKYRGVARRREVSVFDDIETQLRFLEDFKPDVLQSYPSSLVILAHANRGRRTGIKPRLILTGSEFLYASDADFFRSTFGCDSIDDYGCQEIGPLAWECSKHMGYHMNMDSVVLEFVDKRGEQVAPGEKGSILCTSLINHSMPFIRYEVEDQGTWTDEPCSCGRPLPLMKMLEGRKDDFLTAADGRIVSPLLFSPKLLFGNSASIRQYRIIQEARDKITIQVVPQSDLLDSNVHENITREIRKILGEDMQVELQEVDKLERDASGKIRKTISHLQINWDR